MKLRGILIALLLVLPTAAHAEAPDSSDATYRAAVERAVKAFEASDFDAARKNFERAHAISPNARTFRGIGLTALRQRDYLVAHRALTAALSDTRKALTPEQRKEVTELLADADEHVGRLTPVTVPSDARVSIDGQPVTETGPVDVLTGRHVVRAELEGYTPLEQTVDVGAGSRATATLALARVIQHRSEAPAEDAPPPATNGPSHARAPHRLWTWVALGAVPVFAGVSAGIWLSGVSDAKRIHDACNGVCTREHIDRLSDDAGLPWKQTWSTVAAVAAGVAGGAAITLFFVEGGSGERERTAVSVGVTPGGGVARGAF